MSLNRKRRAQATLEMSLSLIGVFILFFATLQIFIWLNRCFVRQQQSYERTRVEAGSADGYVGVGNRARLSIFPGDKND